MTTGRFSGALVWPRFFRAAAGRVEAGTGTRHTSRMSDQETDAALIAAAFRLAAERGWASVTVAAAALEAGLSLGEARSRFSGKRALLRRFGTLMDEQALAAATEDGPVRDRLFDLLMGRFDAMKPHREGVRALMRYLPCDPAATLDLACATRQGMRWMLNAAGQPTHGLRGLLRVQGLVAVWLWAFRAFERDDSGDLSATMAALDAALGRAHEAATWLSGARAAKADDARPDNEAAAPDV